MDILDDMGVSKLSAKVFLKVNYSFNEHKRLLFKKNILQILTDPKLKTKAIFKRKYENMKLSYFIPKLLKNYI